MAQNLRQKTLSLSTISMFASQIVDFGAQVGSNNSTTTEKKGLKNPFKGINFKFNIFSKFTGFIKKHRIISALSAVFVLIVIFASIGLSGNGSNSIPLVGGAQTNFSPANQVTLNRNFEIPIRKSTGEATGNNLKFTLTTVDQSNRILIQGKPATARATKTFIILNLEVQNSTSDQLTVKPVDLIRLIATDGKSFAPDVHNNEVIVEPISIKRTRVGFVVDENQSNFKFTLGEINGSKETIEVNI